MTWRLLSRASSAGGSRPSFYTALGPELADQQSRVSLGGLVAVRLVNQASDDQGLLRLGLETVMTAIVSVKVADPAFKTCSWRNLNLNCA